MESWRIVWRDGIAPVLSTEGLKALQTAILNDDPRLLQGVSTSPPPLQSMLDWPADGACAVGYCSWQGDGRETVGELEEAIARACYEADVRLGEPAGCRWFLNWYDEAPRDVMRQHLLAEVARELAQRNGEYLSDDDCVETIQFKTAAA